MPGSWPAASCSHPLSSVLTAWGQDDACAAPIDQLGQPRKNGATPTKVSLACLLDGYRPALLATEAELGPHRTLMQTCGVEVLRLGFRPIGAMHGLDQHTDHVILHLRGGEAWAQRFRSTLYALWHGPDPHAPRPGLVWGLRTETDEVLGALHFATGLFLGCTPGRSRTPAPRPRAVISGAPSPTAHAQTGPPTAPATCAASSYSARTSTPPTAASAATRRRGASRSPRRRRASPRASSPRTPRRTAGRRRPRRPHQRARRRRLRSALVRRRVDRRTRRRPARGCLRGSTGQEDRDDPSAGALYQDHLPRPRNRL